ncbi:fucose-binding lectin II [uncultured Nostoc sp.]|uniref:fucose-binding lectin II n=1 Tax=uncultured Nostoc sp. TaxID=340711 RepID=UPI0035C9E403
MTYVQVDKQADNEIAKIGLPNNVSVSGTITAHSSFTQKVTLFTDSQELYVFEGRGERVLIGSLQNQFDSPFQVKVEHQEGDKWLGSSLRTGGPYSIGSSNFLIVVAESGDDSDYNDIVVQFSWKS